MTVNIKLANPLFDNKIYVCFNILLPSSPSSLCSPCVWFLSIVDKSSLVLVLPPLLSILSGELAVTTRWILMHRWTTNLLWGGKQSCSGKRRSHAREWGEGEVGGLTREACWSMRAARQATRVRTQGKICHFTFFFSLENIGELYFI
jgi:hypothetical protein